MPQNFIPPHGGYEELLSFQKARIVYDGTVKFRERFLVRRDRTVDQMVQAARSGKQHPRRKPSLRNVQGGGTKARERSASQTNYLLDQPLRRLEQAFLEEGGLRERMTRARLAARSKRP